MYWFEDITKNVLIKRDGRFGLSVFDSWKEFLECFSVHGNFPEVL
jgi:hypothetical protein